MRMISRQILTFIAIFFITSDAIYAQSDSTNYKKLQQILTEARSALAPDKRTSIIELREDDVASDRYMVQISDSSIKTALQERLKRVAGNITIQHLPDETVGNQTFGIIHLSVANLRTKPSHAAEMATQLLLGTVVDILQRDGGDVRVRTPEGYIAWTQTSALTMVDAAGLRNWEDTKRIIYTADFGKSYSLADRESQRVSDLVYGNILTLLAEEGSFYKVAYPDGRTGYVTKEEATRFDDWLASRNANSKEILESAKTMLGLPYLWGGTSVKAVDCSGFTKTSFFMNGYIIPRDASQQALYGEAVDILDKAGNFDAEKALKNLQPADLLFFAGGKHSGKAARVTHVALYLGEGQFIHAAGTVRINSMLKDAANYDDFQTRTVVAAKRYLGVNDPAIHKVADSRYYKNTN